MDGLDGEVVETLLSKGLIRDRRDAFVLEERRTVYVLLCTEKGVVGAWRLLDTVDAVATVLWKKGYRVSTWGLKLDTWTDCDSYWGGSGCSFHAELWLVVEYE